jgi:hypothetical protein
MVRIQVLLTAEEREAFRRVAKREGVSLSAWLRRAGHEQLAARRERRPFRTTEELNSFFEACDRRESGREPEWDEHLDTMRRSRSEGESGT